MATALEIINLGLGKIGASRVTNINPPRSPLERHVAAGYPVWRDSELKKRRWVFAFDTADLNQVGDELSETPLSGSTAGVYQYKFALPNDCLRPIRERGSSWEQRGQFIYHKFATLRLAYVASKPENLFPSEFIDVLACRVARESVEYATQSNTKENSAEIKYKEAVAEAAQLNAFIIGHETLETPDELDTWLGARWGSM